jgi:hypothetical protein
MVACGFSVLTLGDAKPLQNVGGLTAAAMVLSAFATFLIVPAFARKHRYGRPPRMPDALVTSDASEAPAAEGASTLFDIGATAPSPSALINDGSSAPASGGPPNSPRSR